MRSILFILSIAFFLSGCEKFREKRKASVTIHFQTRVGESDFDMMQQFEDSENRNISLELIKFYLSDVSFVNYKDEAVMAEDIVLVELDANGTGSFTAKIKADDYKAISFGIGVSQDLNEADPASFAENGHPLSTLNNTYWGMNGMYRFVMIDGRYFENGDFKGTFSYHSGHNESYRNIQLDKLVTFEKKGEHDLTLYIDIDKILEGPGGNFDIENEANYHGNLDDFHLSGNVKR